MKRIAYVLIDEKGKLFERSFLEGPLVFASEKKAQKVREAEAQSPSSLRLKKIVLANVPCLWQYEQASYRLSSAEFKFIREVLLLLISMGGYWYWMLSYLRHVNLSTFAPYVQQLFLWNLLLAGLAMAFVVYAFLKLLRRLFFFIMDVYLWLKYKREDTSDLETFHVFSPRSFMKLGELEAQSVQEEGNEK